MFESGWMPTSTPTARETPMGRGGYKKSRADPTRDGGAFMALPWAVVDSDAYRGLSHTARSLFIDIARQYNLKNNGRLLASKNFLRQRGWQSSDVIHRALRQLLDSGLIYMTVQGHRPNKASWFALTYYDLFDDPRFDPNAFQGFRRGAYKMHSLDRQTTQRQPA